MSSSERQDLKQKLKALGVDIPRDSTTKMLHELLPASTPSPAHNILHPPFPPEDERETGETFGSYIPSKANGRDCDSTGRRSLTV